MKFYRFLFQISFSLFFVIFCISLPVSAQPVNSKLRLAKTLEKNYEFESALLIYNELHAQNKSDLTVINGIRNCYIGLQDYNNLIVFLNKIITQMPYRVSFQIDLGEAYFLSEGKKRSLEIWYTVIDKNIDKISVYREVAMVMIHHRIFDEATQVYNLALNRFSDQSNLHIEIANIYKTQLDYANATQHYLRFFEKNPNQLAFVQREILKLSESAEHTVQIINMINSFINKRMNSREIKEILAGLYIKERRFKEAFTLYQELESLQNNGIYLQNFALEAFRNHAYGMAIEAYQLIRQRFPDSPQYVAATFQIAQCHSLMATGYRDESAEDKAATEMEIAKTSYMEVIQLSQESSFASDSYVKLGEIFADFYFDLDHAESYYQLYLKNPRGSIAREEVMLNLADVYLIKNDLVKSFNICSEIKHKSYVTLAEYKRIHILYFQGQFTESSTGFESLLQKIGTGHVLANDILDRLRLIRTFIADSVSLAQFTQAELLAFQRKYTESVNLLTNLFRKNLDISSLACRTAIQSLFKINKYDIARDLLYEHQKIFADHEYNDEILYNLAKCEEFLGNHSEAIEKYRELLVEYPNSLYFSDARLRARNLTQKTGKPQK